MRRQFLVASLVLGAVAGATLLLHAQSQPGTPATTAGTAWTVARTPDGQPDLRGTWTASDWALVPVSAYKNVAPKKYTGDVPAYWYEGWDKKPARPYLLIDPPDGRIPVRPEVAKTLRLDEWSDSTFLDNVQSASELDQWARCITRGPIPLIPTSYNMGVRIVQTPGYVAVLTEMIHETRIIPLDGRPPPPRDVRLWMGDARGRWESNTLVVDITNFAEPEGRLVPSVFKSSGAYSGGGEKLRLTERFTRIDADTIDYRVTIDDPTIFATAFTLGFSLKRDDEYEMYEYACHEGNHFVENVLNAARVNEKKTRAARNR